MAMTQKKLREKIAQIEKQLYTLDVTIDVEIQKQMHIIKKKKESDAKLKKLHEAAERLTKELDTKKEELENE